MTKHVSLSEDDIKLAIDFWLYNTKRLCVPSGKDIIFTQSQPDRPGDAVHLSATMTVTDRIDE